jgi:hypothetical protein
VRPDLIPHGMLTELETQLWSLFFEEREKTRKQNNG